MRRDSGETRGNTCTEGCHVSAYGSRKPSHYGSGSIGCSEVVSGRTRGILEKKKARETRRMLRTGEITNSSREPCHEFSGYAYMKNLETCMRCCGFRSRREETERIP